MSTTKRCFAASTPTPPRKGNSIDYLYNHGLRLPDAAQKRVPDLYVQPDFYYETRIGYFVMAPRTTIHR